MHNRRKLKPIYDLDPTQSIFTKFKVSLYQYASQRPPDVYFKVCDINSETRPKYIRSLTLISLPENLFLLTGDRRFLETNFHDICTGVKELLECLIIGDGEVINGIATMLYKKNQFMFALKIIKKSRCAEEDRIKRTYKEIKESNKVRGCNFCGTTPANKTCTGCMWAKYCSKRCQKREWKLLHKAQCAKFYSQIYKIAQENDVM
eukprot:167343_1